MSKSCINWFFVCVAKLLILIFRGFPHYTKESSWAYTAITHLNGNPLKTILFFVQHIHSWASASRSMPPASAFWLPVSQSGTGAFRYRTGSPYTGDGLVPASEFLFIPVPDWLDAGQSDISAFKKSVVVVGGERDPVHVQTAGSARL
jgi:hypothetical protein